MQGNSSVSNMLDEFLFHRNLKYRVSRHMAFLAMIVLVFTWILHSRYPREPIYSLLVLILVNAAFFIGYSYLMLYVLIPRFLPQKNYFCFTLGFLVTGIVLSILKLSISDFIFYSSISPEYISSAGVLNTRYVLINTKDMSYIVALSVIAKFTKEWLIADAQKRSLELKYTQLKLRLLQSHFEPHFLFNTLNNLYALSLGNPQKMLDVIQRLSRVLRFSITEAQKPLVSVSEELDMIENYISIEQIRYGDRLLVESSVSGSCADKKIAPLLLFTLVENCFKHGSSTDAGKPWIYLSTICEKDRICFEAKNSIPQGMHAGMAAPGKGLSKLRERLELIYPKKYSLLIVEGSREFTAKLVIHLN